MPTPCGSRPTAWGATAGGLREYSPASVVADADLRAQRDGLAGQDVSVGQVLVLKYLVVGHLDVAADEPAGAGTADALPARGGGVEPRIDHHVEHPPPRRPLQRVRLVV